MIPTPHPRHPPRSLAALLALLALCALFALAFAQDDLFAGVVIESLGASTPTVAPGHALVFLEITMEPGSNIAAHSHPGDVILVVQTGLFTTLFTQGNGVLTRAGMEPSEIAAGAVVVLRPGDSLAYDGTAAHTMVNEGSEPLVLLVSALLENDRDGFIFHQH